MMGTNEDQAFQCTTIFRSLLVFLGGESTFSAPITTATHPQLYGQLQHLTLPVDRGQANAQTRPSGGGRSPAAHLAGVNTEGVTSGFQELVPYIMISTRNERS
jgi:hypothetical protein